MFSFSEPTNKRIRYILAQQAALDFSYVGVAGTRGSFPKGYATHSNRIHLGNGTTIFERAERRCENGRCFDRTSLRLCWPTVSIEPGSVVALVANRFWSLDCKLLSNRVRDRPVLSTEKVWFRIRNLFRSTAFGVRSASQ